MRSSRSKRILPVLGAAVAAVLAASSRAFPEDRFTVCSITINSDDEIKTFRRHLPESRFQFVELTDHARSSPDDHATPWFTKACQSGVQCDILVVSGHFGNTYAGNYGTTFAGSSGLSLSLDELESRSCDKSCSGVVGKPLEVFLFGCRTLSTRLQDRPLPQPDLALLAEYGVTPVMAERIVEEERYREDPSNLQRMRFTFAGVPKLYGFSVVGPTGEHARPLLDNYFQSKGDYAAHLRRLVQARSVHSSPGPNRELAAALQTSTFDQQSGLDSVDADYQRGIQICVLRNEQTPLVVRLEHLERLLGEPGFLGYLPAIESFFRAHPPSSFGGAELAALQRIQNHEHARDALLRLVRSLKTPLLRFEMLRVARTLGWMRDDEVLRVQREIVLSALQPPVYGEGRDIICSIDPEVIAGVQIRAEDLRPEIYADEFGISALGCLKPSDERIHLALSRSLFDSREWIARNAAIALKQIKPPEVDVQLALAQQLNRPEAGARDWAGQALREVRAADPRVLEMIRKTDPSFKIDWL
jgi:hypothetical protein